MIRGIVNTLRTTMDCFPLRSRLWQSLPMPICASCSSQAPEGSRFCPNCASALVAPSVSPTRTSLNDGPGEDPGTETSGRTATHRRTRNAASASRLSGSLDQGRFLPGTIVAARYRILGLLGRGGMGEVYRADDLKLGQAVALKFLPAALEKDEGRLERFMNEVKIARQISHTNVCRVYDVGEVDGHHYLSMEYVDGEDLATLLRRIGHLPRDKAVQIARELCAGLAAAHDQGVLHRDLKPANIMIDGRGRARITDFGLAGLAEEITGAEVSAGTPAYMAPEQLAGRSVSVRSDLYSLGLVLYELFTGQAAFKAGSMGELQRLQTETTPTNPSTLVDGFDPVVERVILRCLEKEPRDRPASALAVAAALPGGDPLAAALAAGETPSPELVAEAGAAGGLRSSVAIATLAGIAVLTILIVLFSSRTQISRIVSPPKSPEALAERARQTLERLGFPEKPVDSLYGFSWDGDYLEYIGDHDKGPSRWDALGRPAPPLLLFWYRQSPRYLIPMDRRSAVGFLEPTPAGLRHDEPPARRPGAAPAPGVGASPEGRVDGSLARPRLESALPGGRARPGGFPGRRAGMGASLPRGPSRGVGGVRRRRSRDPLPYRGRRLPRPAGLLRDHRPLGQARPHGGLTSKRFSPDPAGGQHPRWSWRSSSAAPSSRGGICALDGATGREPSGLRSTCSRPG